MITIHQSIYRRIVAVILLLNHALMSCSNPTIHPSHESTVSTMAIDQEHTQSRVGALGEYEALSIAQPVQSLMPRELSDEEIPKPPTQSALSVLPAIQTIQTRPFQFDLEVNTLEVPLVNKGNTPTSLQLTVGNRHQGRSTYPSNQSTHITKVQRHVQDGRGKKHRTKQLGPAQRELHTRILKIWRDPVWGPHFLTSQLTKVQLLTNTRLQLYPIQGNYQLARVQENFKRLVPTLSLQIRDGHLLDLVQDMGYWWGVVQESRSGFSRSSVLPVLYPQPFYMEQVGRYIQHTVEELLHASQEVQQQLIHIFSSSQAFKNAFVYLGKEMGLMGGGKEEDGKGAKGFAYHAGKWIATQASEIIKTFGFDKASSWLKERQPIFYQGVSVGAATGTLVGACMGGPVGAAVGAVVGAVIGGFIGWIFESKKKKEEELRRRREIERQLQEKARERVNQLTKLTLTTAEQIVAAAEKIFKNLEQRIISYRDIQSISDQLKQLEGSMRDSLNKVKGLITDDWSKYLDNRGIELINDTVTAINKKNVELEKINKQIQEKAREQALQDLKKEHKDIELLGQEIVGELSGMIKSIGTTGGINMDTIDKLRQELAKQRIIRAQQQAARLAAAREQKEAEAREAAEKAQRELEEKAKQEAVEKAQKEIEEKVKQEVADKTQEELEEKTKQEELARLQKELEEEKNQLLSSLKAVQQAMEKQSLENVERLEALLDPDNPTQSIPINPLPQIAMQTFQEHIERYEKWKEEPVLCQEDRQEIDRYIQGEYARIERAKTIQGLLLYASQDPEKAQEVQEIVDESDPEILHLLCENAMDNNNPAGVAYILDYKGLFPDSMNSFDQTLREKAESENNPDIIQVLKERGIS